MKLKEIKNCYGFHTALSIGHTVGLIKSEDDKQKAGHIIKTSSEDIEIPTEDVVSMMARVNKQVKNASCPNNLKNKFYTFKHKYIIAGLKNNLVTKVVESDEHYCFHFGEFSFHQPKKYFKHGITEENLIIEHGIYIPVREDIEFSMDDYRNCMIGIAIEYNKMIHKRLNKK